MERNINGETLKVSMYDNGERIDVFTESSEGKVVILIQKSQ